MKKTVFALKELRDLDVKHSLMIQQEHVIDIAKAKKKKKSEGSREEEAVGEEETLDAAEVKSLTLGN